MRNPILSIIVLVLAAIAIAGQSGPKADREAFEKDVKKYSSEIDRHPDDPDAYMLRARAYRSLGRQEDAIADLTRAIGLSKHPYYVAQATTSRGEIYLERGEYSAAIADFTAVIDTNGAGAYHPRAYLNRGKANLAGGNREAAIADADRALKLYSNSKVSNRAKGIEDARKLRAEIANSK